MRLDTQDQLTAVNRFLNDAWSAVQSGPGDVPFALVHAAFAAWDDAPSDRAWETLRETLALAAGDAAADRLLSDLAPYVGQ